MSENHKAELKKFTKEFLENPGHALRWSDNIFMLVASMEIENEVKDLPAEVKPLTLLTMLVQESGMLKSTSSSQGHNKMAVCRVSVLQKMVTDSRVSIQIRKDLDAAWAEVESKKVPA